MRKCSNYYFSSKKVEKHTILAGRGEGKGPLLPMRNIAKLQLEPSVSRALRLNTCQAQEPVSTRTATKRVVEILDAKYEKADLPAIIRENCSHLKPSEREKLLSVLLKFESLFDGTLGDWNLPPISFELKEGTTPYHGKAYPIPQIHKATLMKEIDRLCSIGVLEWQPSSRWASPTFIIPKKDGTVRTISDFRELNKRNDQERSHCYEKNERIEHVLKNVGTICKGILARLTCHSCLKT